jgi:uncharacterized protein (DUF1697 family)
MSGAKAGSLHVALLRGVNVAGKNTLPMADLVDLFEGAGCGDVETYIQSGNVLFRAKNAVARRVPALISGAIADRFGYQVPVVMRSAAELYEIANGNPFVGAEVKALHVAFLAKEPAADRIASLDPDRSPPDQFMVRGQEIYLCCPKGLGRSKLTNKYFDSKLGTTSTLRNWKTVLHLAQMVNRPAD